MSSSSTLMLPHEYRRMFEAETSHWWYHALHQWIAASLRRYLPEGSCVLDAGCGTGASLALLQSLRYRALGFDLAPAGLQLAASREPLHGRLCCASVTRLPFPSYSFDAIISSDVLYLLPDEQEAAALVEMRRVLKPGGILLLNLPAYEWLRGEHDQAVATQRRYTAAGLQRKLERAGFEIVRLEYRYLMFLPVVAVVRRLWRRGRPEAAAVSSDLSLNHSLLNACLTHLIRLEERLGQFIRRPFGSSVSAVVKVPG
ncbi:MAG: class I SAM-dependent methyltransferase [candidate division KSB1 bacterium]|nr:class I SAM-dependent methyltransferase [candidate division KSB1 bacterium]MDZ7275977.1 class I SAM-dependent methyltransferase [candidate division KSB1 bacterium]MDZ7285741.1 class I SAM-dependent methyltransferase [candidate division KSB1 bacterium]MDZ7298773.1 class I SAM-dependent methyltransferase [candidate division KSB1 bacterium]MDZ7305956.1 class I SAM-dependent methyltransferase [candidate division KSB1 bacterium]